MALSEVETPAMRWDGEYLREEWRRFKQHAELMFTGPLKSRSEAEKCSYLLIWVGQKGRDVYNTWSDITEEYKANYKYTTIDLGNTSAANQTQYLQGTNSTKESRNQINPWKNLLLTSRS